MRTFYLTVCLRYTACVKLHGNGRTVELWRYNKLRKVHFDRYCSSSHFLSLFLCILFSATRAAEPAVMLASSKTLQCRVDVTDKSKAAGLPRSQLGTRTFARRVCELVYPALQPISRCWPRQALWQKSKKTSRPGAYYGVKPHPLHAYNWGHDGQSHPTQRKNSEGNFGLGHPGYPTTTLVPLEILQAPGGGWVKGREWQIARQRLEGKRWTKHEPCQSRLRCEKGYWTVGLQSWKIKPSVTDGNCLLTQG